MRITGNFLMFCFLLNLFSLLSAQTNSDLSNIELNTCPFEGCQFGQWTARETINVYESEGDTSSIKFTLSENETFTSLYGNVHYEQFGKVVVIQPFKNFQVNDTLTVLRCVEGEFIAYYKGKKVYTDVFWPMKYYRYDEEEVYDSTRHKGKMISQPQIIWWVKIKRNEVEGWLRLKNLTPYCFRIKERIDGMDAFG